MKITTYKEFYIVQDVIPKRKGIDIVNKATGKSRRVASMQAAKWRITRATNLAIKCRSFV